MCRQSTCALLGELLKVNVPTAMLSGSEKEPCSSPALLPPSRVCGCLCYGVDFGPALVCAALSVLTHSLFFRQKLVMPPRTGFQVTWVWVWARMWARKDSEEEINTGTCGSKET